MRLRCYGTFVGGINLPDEKGRTAGEPIRPADALQRLLIPLAACGGGSAKPIVHPGQAVSAGELLARADDDSGVDVFAPLAGKVSSMSTALVAGGNGFFRCPAIELGELSSPRPIRSVEATIQWRGLSDDALRAELGIGGLTTHEPAAEPLGLWVDRVREKGCSVLIANAVEGQPYVTSEHRLLCECGSDVMRGLAILGRAIGCGKVILAVDRRRTGDYAQLVGPARLYNIQRIALPEKYPTGAPSILVKVLTRREVPPGGHTTDVGAAVVDAATCFAAYRWIACRQPQTHRVVTVAGERFEQARNVWAPLGASCDEIAGHWDAPLIHGGPMVGSVTPSGAVVSPATSALLAIDTPKRSTPAPCIRCGWCTDLCPARLNVAALNDAFELGLINQAGKAGTLACVECGVCTYVCPAKLPLAQRVRQLKRAISSLAAGKQRKASTGV